MAKEISYRDLPGFISLSAKGMNRAGARTVNSVAFNSLPKIVSNADNDMKFTGNARRALGFRVNKATSSNPEAGVWTNRGWFALHADKSGQRTATGGIQWQGERWLLVPRAKGQGVITKRGHIRQSALPNVFLIRRGAHALVMYRPKRKKGQAELIGIAVKQAKFQQDTDWDKVIERELDNTATTILRRELKKQARYG